MLRPSSAQRSLVEVIAQWTPGSLPPLIVLSRQDLTAVMPVSEYVDAVADAFRMDARTSPRRRARTNLREQCRVQSSVSHKFVEANEQDRDKT